MKRKYEIEGTHIRRTSNAEYTHAVVLVSSGDVLSVLGYQSGLEDAKAKEKQAKATLGGSVEIRRVRIVK